MIQKKEKRMELEEERETFEEHNFLSSLPRELREEIWSYLADEELYKIRLVCKEWKKGIEKPKTRFLKEKWKRCEEKKEWYFGTRTFYKDFSTTIFLLNNFSPDINLECPFGKLFKCTLRSMTGATCMCFPCVFFALHPSKLKEGFCEQTILFVLSFITLPLYLPVLTLFLLLELIKMVIWVGTCFACGRKKTMKVKTLKSIDHAEFERQPRAPFPTKKEIMENKSERYKSYLKTVEEEVECGVACALCLFSGNPVKCTY